MSTEKTGAGPSAVEPADLAPTDFIDSEHVVVREFVDRVVGASDDVRTTVSRLFRAVRDELRYDPYTLSTDPAAYRASAVLAAESAYCVPKAVVLTAAARAAGIPARLGFADVRNHLQSERLLAAMGTDLFVYHGYSALFVRGEWRKASPAFNSELCSRFGVPPLDFDGSEDALLHAYTGSGQRHMEYVRDHGLSSDLPFDEIMAAYAATYPVLAGQHDTRDRGPSPRSSAPGHLG